MTPLNKSFHFVASLTISFILLCSCEKNVLPDIEKLPWIDVEEVVSFAPIDECEPWDASGYVELTDSAFLRVSNFLSVGDGIRLCEGDTTLGIMTAVYPHTSVAVDGMSIDWLLTEMLDLPGSPSKNTCVVYSKGDNSLYEAFFRRMRGAEKVHEKWKTIPEGRFLDLTEVKYAQVTQHDGYENAFRLCRLFLKKETAKRLYNERYIYEEMEMEKEGSAFVTLTYKGERLFDMDFWHWGYAFYPEKGTSIILSDRLDSDDPSVVVVLAGDGINFDGKETKANLERFLRTLDLAHVNYRWKSFSRFDGPRIME